MLILQDYYITYKNIKAQRDLKRSFNGLVKQTSEHTPDQGTSKYRDGDAIDYITLGTMYCRESCTEYHCIERHMKPS